MYWSNRDWQESNCSLDFGSYQTDYSRSPLGFQWSSGVETLGSLSETEWLRSQKSQLHKGCCSVAQCLQPDCETSVTVFSGTSDTFGHEVVMRRFPAP